MIETFPLQRAIPMIFKGGGDCSKVDWTFLGGSIANWSFVAFVGLGLVALATVLRVLKKTVSDGLDLQADEVADAMPEAKKDDRI
jgi:disulfide bond formation protein DsbB